MAPARPCEILICTPCLRAVSVELASDSAYRKGASRPDLLVAAHHHVIERCAAVTNVTAFQGLLFMQIPAGDLMAQLHTSHTIQHISLLPVSMQRPLLPVHRCPSMAQLAITTSSSRKRAKPDLRHHPQGLPGRECHLMPQQSTILRIMPTSSRTGHNTRPLRHGHKCHLMQRLPTKTHLYDTR